MVHGDKSVISGRLPAREKPLFRSIRLGLGLRLEVPQHGTQRIGGPRQVPDLLVRLVRKPVSAALFSRPSSARSAVGTPCPQVSPGTGDDFHKIEC